MKTPIVCHCERSEAIHSFFALQDGLLRFARNDGFKSYLAARDCDGLSGDSARALAA
jgi:hypothetical protein